MSRPSGPAPEQQRQEQVLLQALRGLTIAPGQGSWLHPALGPSWPVRHATSQDPAGALQSQAFTVVSDTAQRWYLAPQGQPPAVLEDPTGLLLHGCLDEPLIWPTPARGPSRSLARSPVQTTPDMRATTNRGPTQSVAVGRSCSVPPDAECCVLYCPVLRCTSPLSLIPASNPWRSLTCTASFFQD
ncbi:hypothetical protein NDU88_003984 [Pleurodeles waltl]|uniref:Uncharacterized protein n=1 Tax=Pleurodeles waltl TaxID=8319 RepID=A0AAV7LGT0_PLEWA|nr:hypothetical protein NDU88_003984 [Pleurodeles waltl]